MKRNIICIIVIGVLLIPLFTGISCIPPADPPIVKTTGTIEVIKKTPLSTLSDSQLTQIVNYYQIQTERIHSDWTANKARMYQSEQLLRALNKLN